MYSREIEGEPVEFGVSGKLWNGVLVMFDRSTDSLWTQLDGRSIRGEREGARLEHVPSTFTTWRRWVLAHPNTLVLKKDEDAKAREGSRFSNYFDDPDALYFEHLSEGIGDAVPAKTTVFGTVFQHEGLPDQPIAVPESLFESAKLSEAATGTVTVLTSSGHTIRFTMDLRSESVSAMAGTTPLRVDRAYWYAWKRSHPTSEIYNP